MNNRKDIIDSRDVIQRIQELKEQREEWIQEVEEDDTLSFDMSPEVDWHNANTDEGSELDALEALAAEASGYALDWEYGEALIRESYFTEYAQELAEECGMVNTDSTWPNNCIDWEEAAEELKIDYTAVDFDGVTYYIR